MSTSMSYEELKATLRRVYLCYSTDSTPFLTESLAEATEYANGGALVLEYGLINRILGDNPIMVPVAKEF